MSIGCVQPLAPSGGTAQRLDRSIGAPKRPPPDNWRGFSLRRRFLCYRFGHRVRLMPPRYVKTYGKIQKNDAADTEAICEAGTRPTMRFVELKACEQQSILMLHRTDYRHRPSARMSSTCRRRSALAKEGRAESAGWRRPRRRSRPQGAGALSRALLERRRLPRGCARPALWLRVPQAVTTNACRSHGAFELASG
jgi:hypothetical protein